MVIPSRVTANGAKVQVACYSYVCAPRRRPPSRLLVPEAWLLGPLWRWRPGLDRRRLLGRFGVGRPGRASGMASGMTGLWESGPVSGVTDSKGLVPVCILGKGWVGGEP